MGKGLVGPWGSYWTGERGNGVQGDILDTGKGYDGAPGDILDMEKQICIPYHIN